MKHSLERFKKESLWLLSASAGVVLLLSCAGFLDIESRYLDLASHFRLQYLALALIGLLVFSLLRQWRRLLLCLVVAALNLYAIWPYQPLVAPKETESGNSLRFMVLNVLTPNSSYDEVIKLIRSENPDLVVVIEINHLWEANLEELREFLPNIITKVRNDNFGIGVFSKHAFSRAELKPLAAGQPPAALVNLTVDGRRISVLGTHPLPPVVEEAYQQRNREYELLAAKVTATKDPVIVLGDLNTTMWSYAYRRLIQESGLRNVREGVGILPTWPTQLPFMMIPIEHCLVSKEWEVTAARTVAIPGSDHRGLVADLRLSD